MTSHRIHVALVLGLGGSSAAAGGCAADLDVGDKPQNIEPSSGEDTTPAESSGDEGPGMTSAATTEGGSESTGEPPATVSPACERSTPGPGADTAIQWGLICGGDASQLVRQVAIGDDGSTYTITQVEGSGGQAILFGDDEIAADPLLPTLLISKLDPDGNFAWNRAFTGDEAWWSGVSIAVCDDRVYFTANRAYHDDEGIDFGTGVVEGNFSIVALDLDGETVWAQATGDNDDESTGYPSGAVTCRAGEGIAITGVVTGPAEIGGIEIEGDATQSSTEFVVAADVDGVGVWGEVHFDSLGVAAAVSPGGGVVTLAYVAPDIATGSAFALTSRDDTGAQLWQHVFQATGPSTPSGVLVGDDGSVTIAGAFSGTTDLGDGPIVGVDPIVDPADPNLPFQDMDGFVVRFDASGTAQWVTTFAEPGWDFTNVVRIAADGNADIVYTDPTGTATLLSTDGATTTTLAALPVPFAVSLAGNADSGFAIAHSDLTGLDIFQPALTPRAPHDYVIVRVNP